MPIRNPYRGLRGLPADVWIIAATTLVNRAGTMALPFLVLYLTRYLHVSASTAGVAVSMYGLGGLLTAPMAGRLADRFGPFAVMRASLALSGVLLLNMPLVHQIGLILALTLVWGIVAEAARPAIMSALADSVGPEQRKAAIALNRLAVNLGMSIGPALGGFLALVSFPLLFVVDGVTSIAAAALLSTILWARHRGSAGSAFPRPQAAGGPGLFGASVVWRDRAAMLFFVTAFTTSLVFTQHQGAMPLYIVRDLHYRESFYGALFVLNTILIILIEVPLNVAMAHWPMRPALALSTGLVGLGFGALGLAHTPLSLAVTVAIWTFGEMIFFPAATAYVAHLAPPARTGEYMGAFSATFSLALIVGPWAGATLLDRVGPSVTWPLMLACALAGTALLAAPSIRARQGALATD